MRSFRNIAISIFIALGLLVAAPVKGFAQDNSAAQEQTDKAAEAEFKAALKHGPADIQLTGATLALPAGYIFIPRKQAMPVMEEMGNTHMSDGFLGLIVPEDETQKWFVSAEFDDTGFIKDDDQSKIDPDKILKGMQEGVKEDNEDRAARGLPQLEIVKWIEPPHYDNATHHLIWSIEAKEIPVAGQPGNTDNGVNYNTFALGREGYISMNLVSTMSTVESDKKKIGALLANLKFDGGKKYEDFKAGDKVAKYGLMALIGGIAAKKLGLLAVLAALAVKGAKVLVVAALAGAAAVKKFFRRRDPTV